MTEERYTELAILVSKIKRQKANISHIERVMIDANHDVDIYADLPREFHAYVASIPKEVILPVILYHYELKLKELEKQFKEM